MEIDGLGLLASVVSIVSVDLFRLCKSRTKEEGLRRINVDI